MFDEDAGEEGSFGCKALAIMVYSMTRDTFVNYNMNHME